MKPYESTVTINIADLHAYRPVDGPTPPAPIAPQCPPASATHLSMQEVVRINIDRLRLTWAALHARLSASDAALMATGSRIDVNTGTLTVEVLTLAATPSTRRRETVLALWCAVPLLALSMALALSGVMLTKPAQASTNSSVVHTHVTQYACMVSHGVNLCRVVGNNYGYCATVHYPQQDAHCKTLLPPTNYCAQFHYPQQNIHCATLLPPKKAGK